MPDAGLIDWNEAEILRNKVHSVKKLGILQ